ncbi:uncharacterized protein LOC116765380 [Danaus plexippus]|uniref:uncharacterized protein LOC116765380 n=1 Tax=Danaus plexippus TaxID=13037 RepID=UPI002AB2B9EA|nr:uncharacterized protein LOC116765380 [Danaus plexippus]
MFLTERNKLKLLSRNEGKIKSYESCHDLRAWSHDNQTRGRYFRDWIKCNMPICVLPVCTITSFLKTMTWRGRGKGSPRCHPDCKSKLVLDSICSSCHGMKECLRNDVAHEKYFDEEEFETAHWPCERCLEALKSIKMMWKIIIERIFNIRIPKNEDISTSCTSNESVHNIAKAWQNEMVQQTIIVKNLSPCVSGRMNFSSLTCRSSTKDVQKESRLSNSRQKEGKDNFKHKTTETDDKVLYKISSIQDHNRSLRGKLSRCTSFRVKTLDFGCDACDTNEAELNLCKNDLEYLQQRFNVQNDELKRLKSENFSLKLELRQMIRNRNISDIPMIISETHTAVIPKPFETYFDEKDTGLTQQVDSEIVITLKNCQNEKFRKVSLLQVLHKTNGPFKDDIIDKNICSKHEDPVKILAKVQDTFGTIVKREMRIANSKRLSSEKIQIDASYHKMSCCRSNPSCSKISSLSSLNDSVFESSTNVL